MKIQPQQADEDIEIDMSPMIDMVFLLLIFFLVASNIIDEKVQLDIPEATYAKVVDDQTDRVMISVDKDENLYFKSGKTPVSMEELRAFVSREVELDPEVRILIRADGQVRYRVNEDVMKMCGEAGASDMIFAALEQ